MSVRSVAMWKLVFADVPPWTAAAWILDDLFDYPLRGEGNEHRALDITQVENALTAWALLNSTKRGPQAIKPLGVIDAVGMSVNDWKLALTKMTAQQASETLLCCLFDAGCDFSCGSKITSRFITAWAALCANRLAAEAA